MFLTATELLVFSNPQIMLNLISRVNIWINIFATLENRRQVTNCNRVLIELWIICVHNWTKVFSLIVCYSKVLTFSVTECDELCRGRIEVKIRFRIELADIAYMSGFIIVFKYRTHVVIRCNVDGSWGISRSSVRCCSKSFSLMA